MSVVRFGCGPRAARGRTRLAAAAVAVFVAVAGWTAPAGADPPTRLTFEVDVTFPSPLWSSVCGVPVFVRQQFTATATLFVDGDGSVISEIDTTPGSRFTYFSPVEAGGTGRSFTYGGAAVLRTVYPEGAELGAPAILYFNGIQGFAAPGQPAAGHDVYLGEVAFVTPDGIPVTDIVAPIADAGHFPDFATFAEARCGYLTAP
jgi:hypothetical protein